LYVFDVHRCGTAPPIPSLYPHIDVTVGMARAPPSGFFPPFFFWNVLFINRPYWIRTRRQSSGALNSKRLPVFFSPVGFSLFSGHPRNGTLFFCITVFGPLLSFILFRKRFGLGSTPNIALWVLVPLILIGFAHETFPFQDERAVTLSPLIGAIASLSFFGKVSVIISVRFLNHPPSKRIPPAREFVSPQVSPPLCIYVGKETSLRVPRFPPHKNMSSSPNIQIPPGPGPLPCLAHNLGPSRSNPPLFKQRLPFWPRDELFRLREPSFTFLFPSTSWFFLWRGDCRRLFPDDAIPAPHERGWTPFGPLRKVSFFLSF